MTFGFDIEPGAPAVCAAYELEGKGIAAACLLFGVGTIPHQDAAYKSGVQDATDNAARWVMDALDRMMNGDGRTDLHYVAAGVIESIRRSNRQIRGVSQYVGQGMFVGGTVIYCVKNRYVLLTFGGGCIYQFDSTGLKRLSNEEPSDGWVRDAIGSKGYWQGTWTTGTLTSGCRLFALSSHLSDKEKAAQLLSGMSELDDHANTGSMMLRREGNPGQAMLAVMELRATQTRKD